MPPGACFRYFDGSSHGSPRRVIIELGTYERVSREVEFIIEPSWMEGAQLEDPEVLSM